jgi:hypothetical protein
MKRKSQLLALGLTLVLGATATVTLKVAAKGAHQSSSRLSDAGQTAERHRKSKDRSNHRGRWPCDGDSNGGRKPAAGNSRDRSAEEMAL